VTAVLKELHKIVNEAIRVQEPGQDRAEGLTVDLINIGDSDRCPLSGQVNESCERKRTAWSFLGPRQLVWQVNKDMVRNNIRDATGLPGGASRSSLLDPAAHTAPYGSFSAFPAAAKPPLGSPERRMLSEGFCV
jgi:hypothetical protein